MKHDKIRPARVVIPTKEGVEIHNQVDIVRCQSKKPFAVIRLINGIEIQTTKTVTYFENLLSPLNFFRIQKGDLINILHVSRYTNDGNVVLSDDSELKVSLRKQSDFMIALQTHCLFTEIEQPNSR